MPKLTINKFRGLRQDIDYPELPLNYCHQMENLDIDDQLGKLKVRDGSAKLHDGVTFDNIISAYEYRFDVSGDTILIINDDGTLKISDDGAATSDLTLPTGATLESSFNNKYFGWRDHVLITTGNGATNYMLWYGYVDREIDDNTGLFGNVKENTDYIFTKSQLICPNGMFSNVYDTVKIGDYYYFSFTDSKYIEKRDSDFHFIERRLANSEGSTQTPRSNYEVALGTDGTYLYVGYQDDTDLEDIAIEKINPNGWNREAEYVPTSAAVNRRPVGICSDGTHVYVLCKGDDVDPDYIIYQLLASDMTHVADDDSDLDDDGIDICCDDTASTGYFYILRTGEVSRRLKSDLSEDEAGPGATHADLQRCAYDNTNDHLFVSSTTGDGHVYKFTSPDTDLTNDVDYQTVDEPVGFVHQAGTTWMAISTKYGTLEDPTTTATAYPNLLGLNHVSSAASGNLLIGTYFYKIAIVDQDGQEYTLSDPIVVQHTSDSQKATIRITAHTEVGGNDVDEFFRIAYINIYRAYNTTVEAESEATDYKFLEQIDINSTRWVDDETDNEVFYIDHVDNTSEETISSTTFLESSGILDTVKPRYVNGKYLVFLNNKLHVANFSHDGDSYPNRIIRSPSDQPSNTAFYDYYDFDLGDGDVIKAMTVSFGRTLIFKNRKFATFYDGVLERRFTPGLSSEEGYTNKDDEVYFISEQGLYYFNGNKSVNIHDRVKTYFNAASTYANASAFYIDKLDRIVFTLYNDRTFVLNIKHNVWQYYPTGFLYQDYFKNYDNKYIGWTKTLFYEIFNPTYTKDYEDYGGGNGTAISYVYESPLLRFSNNEGEIVTLVNGRLRILLETDDVCQLKLYDFKTDTDGKTLVETHELLEPPSSSYASAQVIWFDRRIGESFSYTISGTTPLYPANTGALFEFHGITFEFMPGGLWNG